MPNAAALLWLAVAFGPMAALLRPLAEDSSPNAAPPLEANALVPAAIEPVATAPVPMAIEFRPVADAPKPTARFWVPSPVADAFWPMAMFALPAPLAFASVPLARLLLASPPASIREVTGQWACPCSISSSVAARTESIKTSKCST